MTESEGPHVVQAVVCKCGQTFNRKEDGATGYALIAAYMTHKEIGNKDWVRERRLAEIKKKTAEYEAQLISELDLKK